MAFRLSSGDVSGFKLLLSLAIMYGLMSILVYSVIHMKFIKPLGIDAPLDQFSESRAMDHLRVLSQEIDGRQEGRPGLKEAAIYIKTQLQMLKDRSPSNIRIEIEETTVDGSFNMIFLGHSISLAYRNHTNIIMRISSINSKDSDPSVLLNGHYDSPLGSPGAGDCGSCVASMLEIARLTTDSGWVPTRPIIFLFNGAEELFMLGTHGFMTTHKWRDTIGAFINLEASGTGGIDLVCQSGPGSWPSYVYAQSAIYPMAHSAAQDIFPVIPGDTDYRIFAQDCGDIPGLDIIFVIGGYFYHTSYDTIERILPGSIQARGENVFSVIKAFTNSSNLQSSSERESLRAGAETSKDERAVFFDYLAKFMVFYSRREAMILHSIPVVIFLLMPFFICLPSIQVQYWFATLFDFIKGLLFHALGVILAIIVPIIFSVLRLMFSSHAMNWFNNPYLAFMMFIPCSLVGLLIPRIIWKNFPLSQDVAVLKTSKEALSNEARFWGAFGFYALLTLAYLVAGLSGGFMTFFTSVSMLFAWITFKLSIRYLGSNSRRSTFCYIVPLIPCLTYSVYFGGFLAQFLIEKMGMMGSLPPPFGYFVPDIIVASVIGVATGWCLGPLIPICGHLLARSSILKFLMHFCILALALSSQFFPYGTGAPKRVVFQHTILTADSSHIVNSSYDFSIVDSNSISFLFKYAPDVAKELHVNSESSLDNIAQSQRGTWLALFPVSFLFSGSLKFLAKSEKQYSHFPHLCAYKPQIYSKDGSKRRLHLEFSLGSLEEVWVAVLNITGPLSSWSFADNILAVPETDGDGPPSYITRLSGSSHDNWTFWLEANNNKNDNLRIEVAVLDQYLDDSAKKLKGLFPDWVDVVAYSSYMSTYFF